MRKTHTGVKSAVIRGGTTPSLSGSTSGKGQWQNLEGFCVAGKTLIFVGVKFSVLCKWVSLGLNKRDYWVHSSLLFLPPAWLKLWIMLWNIYVILSVLCEHITFWRTLEWKTWGAYSMVSWGSGVGIRPLWQPVTEQVLPAPFCHWASWVHSGWAEKKSQQNSMDSRESYNSLLLEELFALWRRWHLACSERIIIE